MNPVKDPFRAGSAHAEVLIDQIRISTWNILSKVKIVPGCSKIVNLVSAKIFVL